MRALRDALIVAAFDLGESLRSRRVIIFLFLYVAGAVASTIVFTEVLQTIEEQLAEQLLVARTDTPGSLTQAIMESPELHRVLAGLIRDRELASALVRIPPIALLYGWITGWIRLSSFAPLDTALWLARYAGTSYCFAFAHLGLALGVSQLTRSVPWSRALGLFAIAFVFGVHGWLGRDSVREAAPVTIDSLRMLFPAAHRLDLWRLEASAVLSSVTILLALGVTYFVLGHLRFARRDA
jgi:hypothetical protein